MAKLDIVCEQKDQTLQVTLKGCIDEDADFERIPAVSIEEYIFNMAQVEAVNSCGIREWVQLLERFPPSSRVTYIDCPECIIDQFNIAADLMSRNATIRSFLAPYYCSKCDKEQSILLTLEDVRDGIPPVRRCSCGEKLDFDASPDQYLTFARNFIVGDKRAS